MRKELFAKYAPQVETKYFENPNYQAIYQSMRNLFSQGEPLSLVSITSDLKQNNQAKVELLNVSEIPGMESPRYIETYIDALIENYKRKFLARTISLLNLKQNSGEIAAQIHSLVESVHTKRPDTLLDKISELRNQYLASGGGLLGKSTGFKRLDSVCDGLRPGHFIVLGGYTSSGKTFFALNLATNLAKQNIPALFISLEMTDVEIFARSVGIMSGINSRDYLKHPSKVDVVEHQLLKNLRIHSHKNKFEEILFEIAMAPEKIIIIDYLQLLTGGGESEYERMTSYASQLQHLAQRKGKTIIALSQISNESNRSTDSHVSFKGSGGILASADLALLLKSGEDSHEIRKEKIFNNLPVAVNVHILKNRHGRIGDIDMTFHPQTGGFVDGEHFDTL